MKYLNDTGLAYLWDKITSFFVKGKGITNDTNITEAGYALDARQNNPDIDGTLANRMDKMFPFKRSTNNASGVDINGVIDDYNNDSVIFYNSIVWIASDNISSNKPFGDECFILETKALGGVILQRAYKYPTSECRCRMFCNNEWNQWSQ